MDGSCLCIKQLVCAQIQGEMDGWREMEREKEAGGEKEREERRREKKKSLTFFFSFSNQPSSSQRTRLALDAVRECYEAYVIYNFFMYLRAYLEDEYGDVDAYFAAKDDVPHLGPLKRVLRPWRMGAPFFRECQQGVLAYVVVRPLMSVAGLLASALGVGGGMSGGEGPFRADRAFVWAALANNASQVWALYCLVLFYTGTRHELAPIRPLSKFLVVKAVRMLFLFPLSFFLSFFLVESADEKNEKKLNLLLPLLLLDLKKTNIDLKKQTKTTRSSSPPTGRASPSAPSSGRRC